MRSFQFVPVHLLFQQESANQRADHGPISMTADMIFLLKTHESTSIPQPENPKNRSCRRSRPGHSRSSHEPCFHRADLDNRP